MDDSSHQQPVSCSICNLPWKARGTRPGAASEGPSSHPPIYTPLIKIAGTDVRPTFLPRADRIGLPSLHG